MPPPCCTPFWHSCAVSTLTTSIIRTRFWSPNSPQKMRTSLWSCYTYKVLGGGGWGYQSPPLMIITRSPKTCPIIVSSAKRLLFWRNAEIARKAADVIGPMAAPVDSFCAKSGNMELEAHMVFPDAMASTGDSIPAVATL